jgi:membrane-bound lytic murein transglycosylase B
MYHAPVGFALLLAVLICAVSPAVDAQEWREKYKDGFRELTAELKRSGVTTDRFFDDSSFKVYDDIRSYFERAAEKTELEDYREVQKRGDTVRAEELYKEAYSRYRKRLGFDRKCKDMDAFIDRNAEALAACEKKYGIPPEVVAAIIGVETQFGTILGKHRAFNVYVSMYVMDYKRKFALEQLRELIAFSDRTDADVFEFRSSYAGAIGNMQFLPYSLNRWFVGSDVYDMQDSIASVGNYLAHFIKTRGTLEKALWAYNPSRLYVELVTDLAACSRDGQ